jgi:segregation and condensation protein B
VPVRRAARHFPISSLPSQRVSGNDLRADQLARLEAVLFLVKEPLSVRKLSRHANLADGTEARTLVGQLNRRLDEAGSAFHVRQIAGGVQLVTRAKFAKWLRRLPHVPGELRLSAPAMETLAVIAYRQPVLRADIEAIRGVACGEILAQLLGRDLIRVSSRSDELGRPYLYNTTKRFLQLFGLRSLDELPRADIWRNHSSHDSPDTHRNSAEAIPNDSQQSNSRGGAT